MNHRHLKCPNHDEEHNDSLQLNSQQRRYTQIENATNRLKQQHHAGRCLKQFNNESLATHTCVTIATHLAAFAGNSAYLIAITI
jgi:hypothetical protein